METIRDSVLERSFGEDLELERNRLFAAEGQAAASYWSAVRRLLWWKPGFDGRVRRGATDLVNSLLQIRQKKSWVDSGSGSLPSE